MGQIAITVDQQIQHLMEKGMSIPNPKKAEEVLLDIGYYRLSFYWAPFETGLKCHGQARKLKPCTTFDEVVRLYYFDYSLRNILLKYITRIEVNFRTQLIYRVSAEYEGSPTWFVNPAIVTKQYAECFDREVYTTTFKRNRAIAKHHRDHIHDRYAPAWKTLEFMTFGGVITLYKALQNLEIKKKISGHFGVTYTNIFENYIEVVKCVRNHCAHGGVLYDLALYPLIRRGPAGVTGNDTYRLHGALRIIHFLLHRISENRALDFDNEITGLLRKYGVSTHLQTILTETSGFQLALDM